MTCPRCDGAGWLDPATLCGACDGAESALPWEAAWTPADSLEPEADDLLESDPAAGEWLAGRRDAAVASAMVADAFDGDRVGRLMSVLRWVA